MFLHCQIEAVTKWSGFSSNVKHFKPLICVLHNSSVVSGVETMHDTGAHGNSLWASGANTKKKTQFFFLWGGHQPNNAADFCEGFWGVITSFTHSKLYLEWDSVVASFVYVSFCSPWFHWRESEGVLPSLMAAQTHFSSEINQHARE